MDGERSWIGLRYAVLGMTAYGKLEAVPQMDQAVRDSAKVTVNRQTDIFIVSPGGLGKRLFLFLGTVSPASHATSKAALILHKCHRKSRSMLPARRDCR